MHLSFLLPAVGREPLFCGSSELRAEGEADFACGNMPLKAKCVVPFIASNSRQSTAAQIKNPPILQEDFLLIKFGQIFVFCALFVQLVNF